MGKIFFPLMLVLLIANAAIVALAGNWQALAIDIGALMLLGGWHNADRMRRLANESLDDVTAQLRAINKDLSRD